MIRGEYKSALRRYILPPIHPQLQKDRHNYMHSRLYSPPPQRHDRPPIEISNVEVQMQNQLQNQNAKFETLPFELDLSFALLEIPSVAYFSSKSASYFPPLKFLTGF